MTPKIKATSSKPFLRWPWSKKQGERDKGDPKIYREYLNNVVEKSGLTSSSLYSRARARGQQLILPSFLYGF
jgi:hypothetical protein